MDISPEEIINLFHEKLSIEYINETNNFEGEILIHYQQLLKILSKDHITYRKYFPQIISILEQNQIKSISYSIGVFFELFNKLIATKDLEKLDTSIINQPISDDSHKKFLQLLEDSFKANSQIRISDFKLDTNDLTEQEVKEMAASLIDMLQDNSLDLDLSIDKGDILTMILPFLRNLLLAINNPGLFYFSCGIFIDMLEKSEYFQSARDFSEEIIISSFNDDIPEYGFFNSFRCYSNQGNVHTALLYANISMYCALNKKKPILNKYLQEIIWQSLKLFRNLKLFPWAIKAYKNIPDYLEFSEYERRSIDHTYFTCLLSINDSSLPSIILDYLHKERESIFNAGISESIPWLITLYNIKRIYSQADFSSNGLGFYLNIFEKIVPETTVRKYKNIIEGDSSKLKIHLKKSLIKLNETRSKSDIVYDNETALKIANRLILDSFEKQDEEAVLLAMMIKSDFSLIFQTKKTEEIAPFKLPNDELERFNKIYGDKHQLLTTIKQDSNILYTWIAVSEENVFQLSLLNNTFQFNILSEWDWSKFNELRKSDYFSSLSFDDTIKDKSGVREVFPEEHIEQASLISETISFSKFVIDQKSTSVYLIKDMGLAKFPHNLILDEQGSFIHSKKPITNILSTEWYLSCRDNYSIEKQFSKSIWVPTSKGDFTLNKLYSSIEDTLKEHVFSVNQELKIEKPLSSDINIVCSHGAKDIASKQIIYPGDTPLLNLSHIIGKGNILIFFVCHSGSYQNEYFKNNITSIVKTYIGAGYKAVLAPFWSLHVNIPKIWLPMFINSLTKGDPIDHALFYANREVSKKYPTPSAWASMHLYGNPNLSINKNSINTIEDGI